MSGVSLLGRFKVSVVGGSGILWRKNRRGHEGEKNSVMQSSMTQGKMPMGKSSQTVTWNMTAQAKAATLVGCHQTKNQMVRSKTMPAQLMINAVQG